MMRVTTIDCYVVLRCRRCGYRQQIAVDVCSADRYQFTISQLFLLNALEQCLEIAFAKSFIPFALNKFEEDRADDGFGEYLKQDSCLSITVVSIDNPFAINEDAMTLHSIQRFFMTTDAVVAVNIVVIRWAWHEAQTAFSQLVSSVVKLFRADRNMLDSFAILLLQIGLYLAFVIGALIKRYAYLAAR